MTETETGTRRGITFYRANPFLTDAEIKQRTRRVINKRGDMFLASRDDGEITVPIAGFWEAHEIDDAKFVKLYANGVKQLADLTNTGARVFELLFLAISNAIGKDEIPLAYQRLDTQQRREMSAKTFQRGVTELIAKQFIAPAPIAGTFWLNPNYLWNGDRLTFIKEYWRKGTNPQHQHDQEATLRTLYQERAKPINARPTQPEQIELEDAIQATDNHKAQP